MLETPHNKQAEMKWQDIPAAQALGYWLATVTASLGSDSSGNKVAYFKNENTLWVGIIED